MKTKEQIRAETGPIARPANYKYGEKLIEWDATLPAGTELAVFDPLHDRILVKLLEVPTDGAILLTDKQPLIGGMRKALVLKCGPGKVMSGKKGFWRKPMSISPGQIVYIGNWVDLEGNGLAFCQEGDVRLWES